MRALPAPGVIGIVVLAAGGSSRLGEPKQLVRCKGETLVARAVGAALGSRCRPVVVVLGAAADEVRAEVAAGAHVVVNPEWAGGMGGSIRRGVAAIDELTSGEARAVVVTLCDQPFVASSLVDLLVETYLATRPLAVAAEFEVDGRPTRGAPALFDRALFPELLGLDGADGARGVLERHAARVVPVAMPEAAFDVDIPADVRALNSRRS